MFEKNQNELSLEVEDGFTRKECEGTVWNEGKFLYLDRLWNFSGVRIFPEIKLYT